MKCKCRICAQSIRLSLFEWVNSILDSNIRLCETCREIDTWKSESYFVRGPYTVSDGVETEIRKYSPDLFQMISRDFVGKRYAFRDKEGNSFTCTVDAFSAGCLTCFREFPHNDCVVIPIPRIERFAPICEEYSRYNYEVNSPVIGYKGVALESGILGDKNYIYELGIPYTEARRDPFETDYQDVYSHFCLKIEDVLNWRNFITSPIQYSKMKTPSEYRLFLVKGEGHCFENTSGNWVSNRLTLLREVTQEEIYKYFSERVINKVPQELLNQFKSANILPYRDNLTREDIDMMCNDHCLRIGGAQCANREIDECTAVRCKDAFMASYYYLILRLRIQTNTFSSDSMEYQFLIQNNHKKEVDSLMRLSLQHGQNSI